MGPGRAPGPGYPGQGRAQAPPGDYWYGARALIAERVCFQPKTDFVD